MRAALTTALVGAAALARAALVAAPDQAARQQIPLSAPDAAAADEASAAGPLAPHASSLLGSAMDRLAGAVDSAVDAVQDARHRLSTELADSLAGRGGAGSSASASGSASGPGPGAGSAGGARPGRHHGGAGAGPRPGERTIYELIRACEHTRRFADAVDEHPDVVRLLNGSEAARGLTLFVPTDDAFRDLPDGHGKPDRGFVERILRYHVALGRYPAGRILHTHTLPTALEEEMLGAEPQRLRTSIGLGGVDVNFYSKVVAVNIEASNGIIHAVNHILVPPFMVGLLLSLFPGQFSTLLLAYEKTGFVDLIHGLPMNGSTVFAPSNKAFGRLGPKLNAFLFNTEPGHRYLRALLKYHVAANATLYTDAFYDETTEAAARRPAAEGLEREHYELATLLGDTRVSVDIARLGGFSAVRVNGFAHISVRDGVARNGVVQVLDQVLMPPRKGRPAPDRARGMSVRELKARLEPYL